MLQKTLLTSGLVCLLAIAAGCGKENPTPLSPSPTDPTGEEAGADGSTLKATAPTAQSPTGGVRVEGEIVLTIANAQVKFASVPLSYRFQVFNEQNQLAYESPVIASGGGGTTSHVVAGALDFNKPHTWRARAEYQGAVGPWSAAASFTTPEGGYIRGSEILDPLTNGKTVGTVHGPVTFVPGVGVRLESQTSYISYALPITLQQGEFSFIATGVDEGNPGDKAKVMTMAEGFGDVTDNDYRMSLEVRGSNYTLPGTVSYRIITGDSTDHGRIFDTPRRVVGWTRAETYFFRMWWRVGAAGYEIRRGSATGPIHDQGSLSTGSRPYRPGHDGVAPHVINIGAPMTRAGALNASHPNMTVRNLWVSARPRPNF